MVGIDSACLLDEVEGVRQQLVDWRRDFHRHPEIGFEERRSAGIIERHLRDWGYDVQTGVAHTGVVGLLEGGQPGPVVMLRFDMDALHVTEENDVDYASQNPGLMHACGHDAHMAIGLGVSDLLARHRGQIKGTIKVVFQPGEEGLNGAEVMVNEGVLEAPRPDVFLSLHVWNDLPVGQAAISAGPVMAAAERWTCTIQGQGGHGALPHQTVDPIVAAAQVVSALQSVVSRNVDPQETAVVTVGTIHGGDAFNVIPPQVELSGTIRTYNPSVREMVLSRVREVVEGVAAACGTSAELTITRLTPAVINDESVTAVMRDAAEQVDDVERVVEGVRTMGSEDAAFFMEAIPGCYVFLGSANAARGLDAPHHNPRFDLDEAVLPLGVKIMLRAVAHYV